MLSEPVSGDKLRRFAKKAFLIFVVAALVADIGGAAVGVDESRNLAIQIPWGIAVLVWLPLWIIGSLMSWRRRKVAASQPGESVGNGIDHF